MWWGGKEEQRKDRKGTRRCPFGGGELLDRLSHLVCVYTLSKLEQTRHEYVFPSAYFAPGMVIS